MVQNTVPYIDSVWSRMEASYVTLLSRLIWTSEKTQLNLQK